MSEIKKILKEADSKLLRVSMEVENERIKSIKLSGDFFAYPETIIEKIENELIGKNKDSAFEKMITRLVKNENAELFGITPKLIAKAFEEEK